MLYPLKFKPIYKDKIWGGDKIKALKKSDDVSDKCGESWELSGVQGDITVVSEGPLKGNNIQELIEIYMGDLVGDKVYEKFGVEFPLLIKIIDANDDLSVQVHPDDEFATKIHNAYGKTESWYILEAEKGSKLISGFNKDITQQEFLEKLENNKLLETVNQQPVNAGDVYYIPAGRIHALGKGIMLVEIQQTSDITYRIFDYNRKGDRELHIDMAKEVLDYSKTEKNTVEFDRFPDNSNKIIKNKFFTINFLPVMNPVLKNYAKTDSFIVYYCVNGEIIINSKGKEYPLKKGEIILIPAEIPEIKILPKKYSELLEIYIDSE